MPANNSGLMGVLLQLKVRGISPGSWINCPPEAFHLCETEYIVHCLTLGRLFSAPRDLTT